MQTQKVNMFYLLELLTDYSDAEHILTANELIGLLSQRYGVSVERRALYGYINALIYLGYDISDFEDNGKGYYIRQRIFSESEVAMLIHSLHLDPECGRGDVKRISDKLRKFVSVYKRGSDDYFISADNCHSVSAEHIELILRAVREKRKISLELFRCELSGGTVSETSEKHTVTAHGVLASGGRFYVLCSEEKSDNISCVRCDMIRNAELVAEYTQPQSISTDDPGAVSAILRCAESILSELILDFGRDVRILTNNRGYFTAAVQATAEKLIPWAMHRLSTCEVVEPSYIRDKIINDIKNSGYYRELFQIQ